MNFEKTTWRYMLIAWGLLLTTLFVIWWAMTLWTDRNLDFWLSYFKEAPVDCPTWLSFLVTLIAPIALVLNVIAEVARLAVQ